MHAGSEDVDVSSSNTLDRQRFRCSRPGRKSRSCGGFSRCLCRGCSGCKACADVTPVNCFDGDDRICSLGLDVARSALVAFVENQRRERQIAAKL